MPSKKNKTSTATSAKEAPSAKPIPHITSQGSRRFTPASFRSPLKRRRAEKVVARTKVAGSFNILSQALHMLRSHWEVFGGLFLVYMLINTVLAATNLLSIDLEQTKAELALAGAGRFGAAVALFETLLVSGVGTATGTAGVYQMVLMVLMSLAIVWSLRQLAAGSRIRVRDALYNSSYPLVQVLLVLLIIAFQLLPATAGAFLINTLIVSTILTAGWQQFLAWTAVIVLIVWSLYMLAASIIALYIVTLPDMTPLKALRSAKDIVRYRRGLVLRKLLFLPLALMLFLAVVLIPVGLLLPAVAMLLFFVLSMALLSVTHGYIYVLYRELIK